MDKKSYLQELTYHLRSLPTREQRLILADIEDQFKIGAIDGKDEQTLILELGPPERIAANYVTPSDGPTSAEPFERESDVDFGTGQQQRVNLGRLLVVILVNVIFIIGPVIGFYGLLIGGWALIATGLMSPVIWLASLFFRAPVALVTEGSWLAIGFGIALIASALWYLLTKVAASMTRKYIELLSNWVKG